MKKTARSNVQLQYDASHSKKFFIFLFFFRVFISITFIIFLLYPAMKKYLLSITEITLKQAKFIHRDILILKILDLDWKTALRWYEGEKNPNLQKIKLFSLLFPFFPRSLDFRNNIFMFLLLSTTPSVTNPFVLAFAALLLHTFFHS